MTARDALSAAFTVIIVALALIPLQGWLLMLVVGAVHGLVPAVPAFGFGTSVLAVIGVGMFVSTVRRLFGK
ncbi:hypothetical protein ACIP88_05060 [Streptomyces uncialis]|uniref:hypothetical protein n=1 Tax=Streptomyces uncialis TaxID=1048205 RepID=UPI00381D441D